MKAPLFARQMASASAPASMGTIQVPLAQLGTFAVRAGPPMIKDENGSLVGYVFVDTSDSDLGGYVERAKAAGAEVVIEVETAAGVERVRRGVEAPAGSTVKILLGDLTR